MSTYLLEPRKKPTASSESMDTRGKKQKEHGEHKEICLQWHCHNGGVCGNRRRKNNAEYLEVVVSKPESCRKGI